MKLIKVSGSARVDGIPVVEVGETITIKVDEAGLKELKTHESATNPIGLYVDDVFLRGCPPELQVSDPSSIRFDLAYKEENKAFWQRLLGRPLDHPETRVKATVGLADGSVVAKPVDDQDKVSIKVYRPRLRWGLVGLVLLLVGLLVRRAKVGDMLRVSGDGPISERPYSLGRSQMAWWFGHVVVAYLYVWAVLGITGTITTQLLALLGIGAGTALGSTMIDASKAEASVSELRSKLDAAEAALVAAPGDARLAAARDAARAAVDARTARSKADLEARVHKASIALTKAPGDASLAAERNAAQAALDAYVASPPPRSINFLTDVLTDARDYSLHRLQMLVWTLILTAIFWYTVWFEIAMPEFSATLLALMGLSSGTYLGFKFPEKS